jgi:hypothetical protein
MKVSFIKCKPYDDVYRVGTKSRGALKIPFNNLKKFVFIWNLWHLPSQFKCQPRKHDITQTYQTTKK